MTILHLRQSKTDAEWSDLKADEYVKEAQVNPGSRHAVGAYEIEIRSVEKDRTGVMAVYIRAWQNNTPIGFGPDGSIEIERVRLHNPPILVPDPVGPVERVWVDPSTKKSHSFFYREDTAQALLLVLADTVRIVGKPGAQIVRGKTGQTTDTIFPNAGSGTGGTDGVFRRDVPDESWSALRGGAGNGFDEGDSLSTMGIEAGTTTDLFVKLERAGFGFDTSTITGISTATIESVTFSARGATIADTGLGDLNIQACTFAPADLNDPVIADYAVAQWGDNVVSATAIAISAWNLSGYNDFLFNYRGLAHIDRAGIQYYGLRMANDMDNSPPTWSSGGQSRVGIRFADTGGTTQDPKLTFVHFPDVEAWPGAPRVPFVKRGRLWVPGWLPNATPEPVAEPEPGQDVSNVLFKPPWRKQVPRPVPPVNEPFPEPAPPPDVTPAMVVKGPFRRRWEQMRRIVMGDLFEPEPPPPGGDEDLTPKVRGFGAKEHGRKPGPMVQGDLFEPEPPPPGGDEDLTPKLRGYAAKPHGRRTGPMVQGDLFEPAVVAPGQDQPVPGALKTFLHKSKLWLPGWARVRETDAAEIPPVPALQRWRKIGLRLFKGL